jgi:hypothetical protein
VRTDLQDGCHDPCVLEFTPSLLHAESSDFREEVYDFRGQMIKETDVSALDSWLLTLGDSNPHAMRTFKQPQGHALVERTKACSQKPTSTCCRVRERLRSESSSPVPVILATQEAEIMRMAV